MSKLSLGATLILSLSLNGCAVLAPLSILTSSSIFTDVRSIGNQIDDQVITTRVHHDLTHCTKQYLKRVVVDVLEGRIMLTGYVENKEGANEAVRIAWGVPGVREVINELIVGKLPKVTDEANDSLIANQIRAKFLLEKNFTSSAYKVTVTQGKVYILGIAKTKAEFDKTILIASNVNDVYKVISHVIMKDDPRRVGGV